MVIGVGRGEVGEVMGRNGKWQWGKGCFGVGWVMIH